MEKIWVNVSFQSQIVLGVKHQRAGYFKTMKERGKLPKDDPSVVAKKRCSYVMKSAERLFATQGGGTDAMD